MNLKGYIIEKYNNMSNAYTCNCIVSEASKLDVDLRIIGIHDTEITQEGIFNMGELLKERDFVINRYKWGELKNQINRLGKRSYNTIDAFKVFVNKYEQVSRLKSNEFLMPKYLLGTMMLSFETMVSKLGEPFVAKGLESSMGEQIFLIQNEEDQKRLMEEFGCNKEWLFEEYIATSYGRDIRLYSIRGNVVACMQRKSNTDFRANVALGATVEPYFITESIRTIARDIYQQTGLDFLGIDLLFGNEKPFFCEINVMPGLEGIESASGVNIARMIIETIKEDFVSG